MIARLYLAYNFGETMVNLYKLLAYALIGCGSSIIILNWAMVYSSWRTSRSHSAVPLIGAALCGFGLLIIPLLRSYAWAVVLIDYGTLIFFYSLPRIIREMWQTSHYNLVAQYHGSSGPLAVCIRLFQRGIFTIDYHIQRNPDQAGLVRSSNVGTWRQEGEDLRLQIDKQSTLVKVMSKSGREWIRISDELINQEINRELFLDSVDLNRD